MLMGHNINSVVSTPWTAKGHQRKGVPLPGLNREAIEGLKACYPGTFSLAMQDLLKQSCGIAGTAIGNIDFTGQWYDEEPLAVFRPCLTLAVDNEGRRWIAEGAADEHSLLGPVWCVLSEPKVGMYVSDDLASFLTDLRHRSCEGEIDGWLSELTAAARVVWKHRTDLALRSGHPTDPGVRRWVATLPSDAYVYDLRAPSLARGWPYGLAGSSGGLFRCGRAPVFAVSGPPASDRWAKHLAAVAASFPVPEPAVAALYKTGRGWAGRVPAHIEARLCA